MPRRTGKGRTQPTKRPHGQIRRSQVIAGSGPGAMLDLPRHAAIVAGLDDWGDPDHSPGFERVREERVRARLARDLELPHLQLFSPPVEGDSFGSRLAPGILAFQFPRWFVAQVELEKGQRPLVNALQLDGNRWIDDARRKHPVVPVRFVRACKHGHIEDIDWRGFVHRGQSSCSQPLRWQERGSSFDFVDIFIGCECGKSRSLIEATKRDESAPPLGWCDGEQAWLERRDPEPCRSDGKPVASRLLVRNASNAYFALTDHAISIPEANQELRAAVSEVSEFITHARDLSQLQVVRGAPRIAAALRHFTDEQVWAELQRRKDPRSVDARAPKLAEFETFLAVKGTEGTNDAASTFYAVEAKPPQSAPAINKVLRLERLREVSVLVGFTRFEPPSTDVDGELDLNVRSGQLAHELKWLPAVENHGEGIFLGFDGAAIKAWRQRKEVITRAAQLQAGWDAWAATHKTKLSAPPIEYVMLHSLSHLLMTALSLECGYSSSSLRERIYALEAGYGLLIHTGTPDAEGTLGGLVHATQDLDRLLSSALDLGAICSNDPVCASHHHDNPNEERFLHGAACHGCLLIAETSCEMRNDHLDRALVVQTVDGNGCHFFESP